MPRGRKRTRQSSDLTLEERLREIEWEYIKYPAPVPRYTRVVTPKFANCLKDAAPAKLFDAMWNNQLWTHLQTQTSNSAAKRTITEAMIKRFFGQLLMVSTIGVRDIKDCYSTTGVVILYPGKEYALQRDQWLFLDSHLQCEAEYVESILNNDFKAHATPGTLLTCDEAYWTQEGYCLNLFNGYLFSFTHPKLYTSFQALLHFGEELSNTTSVQHITADKQFGNLEVAQQLMELGVDFTLSCKADAQPSQLFSKGLGKDLGPGNSEMATCGDIVAACYYCKKKLYLLSSWFKMRAVTKTSEKLRSPLLNHYDNTKRWTNQFNQLDASYHFDHRHQNPSSDWLIRLFEFACTNAFIIHRELTKQPLTHKDFLREIALYLLTSQ